MKATILFFLVLGIVSGISGQNTIELTFSAVDNVAHVQTDSIKVINLTQGGETMIYWPDTTCSIELSQDDLLLYVGYASFNLAGIPEVNEDLSSFSVQQNFPNTMGDWSDISISIPRRGMVKVLIADMQGKVVLHTDRQLDEGHNRFRFYPGNDGFYLLTAYWNGESRSIKMISAGHHDRKCCRLEYAGSYSGEPVLKNTLQINDLIVRESGILDTPEESSTYIFQFAFNIPCPGMPVVEYEGQLYNTNQIFSQCWMKENLNVGTMINNVQNPSINSIIEKYCYNNEQDSCSKYGGLYQWDEMMYESTGPGAQGICPPGWHLPSDAEWKVLEGGVDSQYGIGDPEWDISLDWRGFDAAGNLKSANGWDENGNGTDLYGFSARPGGYRLVTSGFYNVGYAGDWWSSSEGSDLTAWGRYIIHDYSEVARQDFIREGNALSVRCLRDY